MSKKLVGVLVVCVVVLALFVSQQVGQTAPALTALDYAEIEQLYARYAFSADWDHDDGEMWAGTFTEDGVFDVSAASEQRGPKLIQGHEELKASWSLDNAIHKTPRHFTTNILIEPTPEGARGSAYVIIVGGAEDGQGQRPFIRAKGTYDDELVKTDEGWRFKKRIGTFHRFGDGLLDSWAQ